MTTLLTVTTGAGLLHILLIFLVALVVILALAGLIWAIETYIIKAPLPNPVRLLIGLVLIILVIILILNGTIAI